MYKIMGMFRFKPELDTDEARRHWADVHGPLIAKFPGLISYTQSDPVERLGGGLGEDEESFDAYIAHWYPDRDSFMAAMESPEWAAADADGATIVDGSSAVVAAVEERVILDGPRDGFKSLWIARFTPDQPKQQSSDHWTNNHGPLTLEAGGFERYVQNHTIELFSPETPDNPGFDGFAEHWFADRDTYREVTASPAWQELGNDGVNFLDDSRSWGVAVVERVLGPQDPPGA